MRDKQRALKTLGALSDALIVDLVRRAGTRAEGDSSSTGPRGRSHISDPTLAAVIRKEGKFDDPVWEAVRDIAQTLDDMATLAQRIDEKVRYVTGGAERAKQSTIAHCEACGREIAGTPKDRVRSGYCARDYQRWLREGRPYRATFEASVKAENPEK